MKSILFGTVFLACFCLVETAFSQTPASCDLTKLVFDPSVVAAQGPRVNGRVAPEGAAGSNVDFTQGKRADMHIDEQRIVGDLVQFGRAHNKPDVADKGWRAVEWAVSHEHPDGQFDGGDAVHGSTMFLESAIRSYRLDQMLKISSPGHSLSDKLLLATRSLAQRDPDRDPELIKSNPMTHRYWIKAALFGGAADIYGDDRFKTLARWNVLKAISAQRADGVNPEKGGYDLGYQATGLLYISRYLATCPPPDLRTRASTALRNGLQWLSSRVGTDGSVNGEGSTRIGVERVWNGRVKGVPYGIVADAFASGAHMLGDANFKATADKIAASPAYRQYFGITQ